MALSERISVRIESLPVESLQPAPYNSHTATQEALNGLAASIAEFGLISYPVVNRRKDGTTRLIGGHKRTEVLKLNKSETVECIVVEFDDETERKANFALNNRAIQGEFVPELTRALLDRLKTRIPTTLFTMLRLDKLVKSATRAITHVTGVDDVECGGHADEDDEVKLSKTEPESQHGAFYRLGDHVLFCGKIESRKTLSGFPASGADMAFTSIQSKRKVSPAFVDAHIHFMLSHTDGAVYIATDTTTLPMMQSRFVSIGGHWSNTLMWFNVNAKPTNDAYCDVTIPVLYGWRDGAPHYFGGDNDQGNVFKLTRAPKSELPVEVVVKALLNSSKAGQIVLDTDIGRGSSLIAAQKTNRKLFGFVGSTRDMDAVRIRWSKFVYGDGANWKSNTTEFK